MQKKIRETHSKHHQFRNNCGNYSYFELVFTFYLCFDFNFSKKKMYYNI